MEGDQPPGAQCPMVGVAMWKDCVALRVDMRRLRSCEVEVEVGHVQQTQTTADSVSESTGAGQASSSGAKRCSGSTRPLDKEGLLCLEALTWPGPGASVEGPTLKHPYDPYLTSVCQSCPPPWLISLYGGVETEEGLAYQRLTACRAYLLLSVWSCKCSVRACVCVRLYCRRCMRVGCGSATQGYHTVLGRHHGH